jgi:hypothetical protein
MAAGGCILAPSASGVAAVILINYPWELSSRLTCVVYCALSVARTVVLRDVLGSGSPEL